ncbi:S-layer homology domain-containing protein [Patescibacteria group bacterium]|nr:S-layer homology domain-containing protein [Patescibacteria group bacterium]MBU1703582.1 S-layer homology domain-containing protein [Patescibacteria group bacterium]MBU1954351.1 S-layer homology domain-containing protein [Patescibacteria group bacterium]
MTNRTKIIILAGALLLAVNLGCPVVGALSNTTTFKDVPATAWYYADVEALVQSGIIDGSIQNYRPQDNLNRAEMAKLIVEAFDLTLETPDFETFQDVKKDQWYFSYIETVAANGIAIGYLDTNGNLNNLFGPNDPITREQAAKMIVLGANMELNTDCNPNFTDLRPENWSYEYISTLYNNQVITGYADGSFKPGNNINRAEIAKIIRGAMNPATLQCDEA